jgi:Putative restriction endonuclease
MTTDEFLAWELDQTERHEFVGGEVYAMAGGDDRHTRVTLNVASLGGYFYPDVMVTCSAADHAQRQAKQEPALIVEVLSPSTRRYDLVENSFHYRQIPTMRDIVPIDVARMPPTGPWHSRHGASRFGSTASACPSPPRRFSRMWTTVTATTGHDLLPVLVQRPATGNRSTAPAAKLNRSTWPEIVASRSMKWICSRSPGWLTAPSSAAPL